LYILGALALSNVSAYINLGITGTVADTAAALGGFTYTAGADCLATATATTLGMNNIYHQYYTFKLTKGTATWSTAASTTAIGTTKFANTFAYNACYHTHLYNWMAQPHAVATTAISGLGNQVVAYGYALTGTALTSCTLNTFATGLYSSTAKTFSGAAYQTVIINFTKKAATAAATTDATNVMAFLGSTGYWSMYTVKDIIVSAYSIGATDGIVTKTTQNAYWDFM